jgi:8-oxo-dGTP pyrophosphatase MutT (NUDIX family)
MNSQEAVKREVLEETGLVMEPTTLIMVESAAGLWFRFVLTGSVVGKQKWEIRLKIQLVYIFKT